MLKRGVLENAKLCSSHYWRYPLIQGGLEIKCKISIKMYSSFNMAASERYSERCVY